MKITATQWRHDGLEINWFMRSVDIINARGVNPSELLAIDQNKGCI
jgi:hypothetical protein